MEIPKTTQQPTKSRSANHISRNSRTLVSSSHGPLHRPHNVLHPTAVKQHRSIQKIIPTPVSLQQYTLHSHDKLFIVMIGLPARGKSHTAKKLNTYLLWLGIRVRLFNIEDVREQRAGRNPLEYEEARPRNSPSNSPEIPLLVVTDPQQNLDEPKIQVVTQEDETNARMTKSLLEQALTWLETEGDIAIFIPWCTTHHQRRRIITKCNTLVKPSRTVNILFVENVCDDPAILHENILHKINRNAFLKSLPVTEATKYVQNQIGKYARGFETINDDNISYVKLINLRSKVISNRIFGHLAATVTNFLMSIHVGVRPVWLTNVVRPCKEEAGVTEFDSGDERFRRLLGQFVEKRIPKQREELVIFTSTAPEAISTVEFVTAAKTIQTTLLNPLNLGDCTGMSKLEISQNMPEVWQNWKKNCFHYRLPNGESYSDLVQRLDPFMLQLERFTVPVLVVAHETILQVLYCYFKSKHVQEAPMLHAPKWTVIEMASTSVGWTEKLFPLVKS